MKNKILVRVDGNNQLGIGHVTRCIHLINHIRNSYEIIFFLKKNRLINKFITSHNFLTHQLNKDITIQEEIEELSNISSELLILDIRNEKDNYYKSYSKKFKKVLRIDDSDKSIKIYSDLYLNYNLYTENINFKLKNKKCELFLGPQYYILNPAFKKYENYQRNFNKDVKNILISMGGGDPKNLTIKIAKAIVTLNNIRLNLILGKLYPDIENIEFFKKKFPLKIKIYYNIKNMEDFMAKNHLIITTGGNTSFEAAFMGIPGALLNQIELQNQNSIKYEEQGIFFNLGLGKNLNEIETRNFIKNLIESEHLQREMSNNGKNLFNTSGIKEVIEKFLN